MEPGIPRVGVAKGPHMLPRLHERLLDRVLCAFRVAEDEPGGAVQSGIRRSHQDGERVVVTRLCSFDERSLHVATAGARP